jgi:hypothetical protein
MPYEPVDPVETPEPGSPFAVLEPRAEAESWEDDWEDGDEGWEDEEDDWDDDEWDDLGELDDDWGQNED